MEIAHIVVNYLRDSKNNALSAFGGVAFFNALYTLPAELWATYISATGT